MPTCPIEFLFLGAIGDIDYVARPGGKWEGDSRGDLNGRCPESTSHFQGVFGLTPLPHLTSD